MSAEPTQAEAALGAALSVVCSAIVAAGVIDGKALVSALRAAAEADGNETLCSFADGLEAGLEKAGFVEKAPPALRSIDGGKK